MSKIKSFCFIVLSLLSSFGCSHAGNLVPPKIYPASAVQEKVEAVSTSQLGVRELTGHNDGIQVEKYLKSVNLGKGYAWCAAFCSWVYTQSNVKNLRSAWAPAWFTDYHVIFKRSDDKGPLSTGRNTPQKGDMVGIYNDHDRRIGHVGILIEWGANYVTTIEGNTNIYGSHEGDGVYKKKRIKRQIYSVSRWINAS
jgi:hypothetical protein